MTDELITLETAILAKECLIFGYFNEPCGHFIDPEGKSYQTGTYYKNSTFKENGNCAQPTQSLLSRWLREKHGIYVNPDIFYEIIEGVRVVNWVCYLRGVHSENTHLSIKILNTNAASSYELALEAGLLSALNYLKTKT